MTNFFRNYDCNFVLLYLRGKYTTHQLNQFTGQIEYFFQEYDKKRRKEKKERKVLSSLGKLAYVGNISFLAVGEASEVPLTKFQPDGQKEKLNELNKKH